MMRPMLRAVRTVAVPRRALGSCCALAQMGAPHAAERGERGRERGLEPLWIAQGKDATGWDANELALIDAADEMYRDTMISDATWATLSERYDTHQMFSIAATAARYRMVSMTLNAFGVQPLPDDERFPELEGY